MTERGLPIVDGAPACPFVAFADDRDERSTSPDHRHRCYAEGQPAPRALAHQEAYCLSSAFPVCPTFQDWAKREAARTQSRPSREAAGGAAAAAAGPGQSQRNPPRNWAAPPPWLSRNRDRSTEQPPAGSLWADEDGGDGGDRMAPFEPAPAAPEAEVPRHGRGLSGSYADRVASDPAAAIPAGMAEDDLEAPEPPRRSTSAPGAAAAAGLAAASAASAPAAAMPPAPPPPSEDVQPGYAPDGWDDEEDAYEPPPPRIRRREREELHADRSGRQAPPPNRQDSRRTLPAPEWERAKPLEAYPTIRSRRLGELSIPPILVAIVALALAAAVLFALPGLLGFGSPQSGASPTPTTPVITPIPSINPTPIPQPTPQLYTVQSGDTLSRIAGRFGIPLNDLIAANTQTLPDPNKLQVGQQIIIPPKSGGAGSTGIPSAT